MSSMLIAFYAPVSIFYSVVLFQGPKEIKMAHTEQCFCVEVVQEITQLSIKFKCVCSVICLQTTAILAVV